MSGVQYILKINELIPTRHLIISKHDEDMSHVLNESTT